MKEEDPSGQSSRNKGAAMQPPPSWGQGPFSLVIKVVAFELGHVALEGGDVLA